MLQPVEVSGHCVGDGKLAASSGRLGLRRNLAGSPLSLEKVKDIGAVRL
jgi:hypothetical protein